MATKSDWPQFGPEDANGFRSFYLAIDQQDFIRVSVRLSVLQEYAERTAGDFSQYSPQEQESLKAAAALVAARAPYDIQTSNLSRAEIAKSALMTLLESGGRFTRLAYEKWFPGLATIALQLAGNACLKKTLNNVAQAFNVPPVTTEKSVEILLDDLNTPIKRFLRKTGRRLETPKFLRDVQTAINKLKLKPSKKPTQEKVAERMGIDPRTLRKSMTAYGIKTWDEMLLVCEYWEELNTPSH